MIKVTHIFWYECSHCGNRQGATVVSTGTYEHTLQEPSTECPNAWCNKENSQKLVILSKVEDANG